MNNQSIVLLAIGVFVSLIVAVAAIDHYLFEEHPPAEVDGLIWRVENAFSRIKDLEAVVEVSENSSSHAPVRMLVRLLNRPLAALSVRYLDPADLEGQVFTVENDLLSHYTPSEAVIVVKRWVGVPLAAVGLASLDLAQLREDWLSGQLTLQVLQSVPAFTSDVFSNAITLTGTLTEETVSALGSFASGVYEDEPKINVSFVGDANVESSIRGEYILEARDAGSGELVRMTWIDRESYLVQNVVFFVDGQREKTVRIQRIAIDEGLTEEDVLTLPRDVEIIRG